MLERLLTPLLLRDLAWSPVVGLVGSRQVGKTTLAKHLQSKLEKPSIYLDLELSTDRFKLNDAQTYLSMHSNACVIVDEVQVMPELFPILRGLADQQRVPGRFLLLGSAAAHLVKNVTESLAGRIVYHELPPLSLSEVSAKYSLQDHWLRGGFPLALTATDPSISRKWMDNFVETFIFRDLALLGYSLPSVTIRNMMSMLAHLHGGLLNVSQLAKSLGISQPTANRYLEILEGSFLIRRLPPYFSNIGKRLTKSPKLFVRDSGLVHHLLRVFNYEQLVGHPDVGNSWEGYVTEQIIREAPEFTDFYHYRTQAGAEMDLLLVLPNGKHLGIEIKFSNTPKLTKGFYNSIEDLKLEQTYVITPGSETFLLQKGITICSLPWFLKEALPNLTS